MTTYPTPELAAYLSADIARDAAYDIQAAALREAKAADGRWREARRALCLSIACPLCEAPPTEPCNYLSEVSMWPTHSWRDELAGANGPRAYEAAVERLEVETRLKARVADAGRVWSELPGPQRDRLRVLVTDKHPSPWAEAEFAKVVAIVYATTKES